MGSSGHCSDRLVCTNPFEWFEIHPNGQVFLCCPAWLKHSVGNLLENTVAEVWNSPKAQQIRRSIFNGSFQHCNRKRCPRLHTGNPPVQPLDGIDDGEVQRAILNKQAELPYGPKTLNLCYDPSCNLACPSCRSDFFSNGAEAAERLALIDARIRNEAAVSAETIKISGTGDPFGSQTFRSMLQEFRPENYPRLKSIYLHTNGQLWNEQVWKSMPDIHPFVTEAEISVDAATPETYACNRRGGDFARLTTNFEYLQSLPVELKISFVIQQNNFREIPAFVALGERFGFRVYFSQLVNWGTFSREEFRARAVHLPDHPDHEDLIRILRQVAGWERVDLGNLDHLAGTAI